MVDGSSSQEKPPVEEPVKRVEYLDLNGGKLGFHYTIDRGLATGLEHGLLSRMEEAKRGLRVRVRASRSYPDSVYFTTRANDVYFLNDDDKPVTDINDLMDDVVGIAIDRPRELYGKQGHFVEKDFVDPSRFKMLVIIDRALEYKPSGEQKDIYDKFKLVNPYPEDRVTNRVATIRKMCEEKGIDIPVYGISGNIYYPERKTYREVMETLYRRK